MASSERTADPLPSVPFYARLGWKLGMPRLHSDVDLAAAVEKRLPATVIRSLVEGGLSDAEVYGLVVPRRTLAHRVAKREPLTRDGSDTAVRAVRAPALAGRACGAPERA